jgi:hypothetical protein
MGNAIKTLAQHLHRCALDRLGCVSILGVRTSLCIGLANPLKSSCNARNATFCNTAMGLIAISFKITNLIFEIRDFECPIGFITDRIYFLNLSLAIPDKLSVPCVIQDFLDEGYF